MINQGLWSFHGKRVLLLQGPVGPFFRHLAYDLRQAGAEIYKINFNGGDCLFYPSEATVFRGKISEWPSFFEGYLKAHQIEMVMLFGDCRPVHQVAHRICRHKGVEVGVFEEGYLRPDFISFERFGVNGHSQIPRNPRFYLDRVTPEKHIPLPVGNSFWYAMTWAMLYNTASSLVRFRFPHYVHHRTLTIVEGLLWLRSFWRKSYYARKEQAIEKLLEGQLSHKFFLVPLQTSNDAQIFQHSDFSSIEHFIGYVMESFANEAPKEMHLVIKHHPLDRGIVDYSQLIEKLCQMHGLAGRVLYIHDLPLPNLLKHARGVVVINSTVGLSALHHNTPLKIVGRAIYDVEGLVYRGDLATFWRDPIPCDPKLYRKFLTYLIRNTQINGSFYRRLPLPRSRAGIQWTFPENTKSTA